MYACRMQTIVHIESELVKYDYHLVIVSYLKKKANILSVRQNFYVSELKY